MSLKPPIPPMEARSVDAIPAGPEWQYEPKWDGFRCLVFRDGERIALQSKAGKPLTRYFPDVVAAAQAVKAKQFVFDGEIVVPRDGAFSFDDLLQRIHPAQSRIQKLAAETPAQAQIRKLFCDLAAAQKSLERAAVKKYGEEGKQFRCGFDLIVNVADRKALLALRGPELFALARANNTCVGFEASCGGGIPIIDALTRGLLANRIDALLGEGPVWDSRTQQLYWVDIEGYKVHCYNPATRAHRAIDVGEYVGSAAIRASGGLVLALKSGFASLDLETEKLAPIADAEAHLPGNRFNDGKCDPAGRFWAGSLGAIFLPRGRVQRVHKDSASSCDLPQELLRRAPFLSAHCVQAPPVIL